MERRVAERRQTHTITNQFPNCFTVSSCALGNFRASKRLEDAARRLSVWPDFSLRNTHIGRACTSEDGITTTNGAPRALGSKTGGGAYLFSSGDASDDAKVLCRWELPLHETAHGLAHLEASDTQ